MLVEPSLAITEPVQYRLWGNEILIVLKSTEEHIPLTKTKTVDLEGRTEALEFQVGGIQGYILKLKANK